MPTFIANGLSVYVILGTCIYCCRLQVNVPKRLSRQVEFVPNIRTNFVNKREVSRAFVLGEEWGFMSTCADGQGRSPNHTGQAATYQDYAGLLVAGCNLEDSHAEPLSLTKHPQS